MSGLNGPTTGRTQAHPYRKTPKNGCGVLGHKYPVGSSCSKCADNNAKKKNGAKVKQATTIAQQAAAEATIQTKRIENYNNYTAQLNAKRSDLVHVCFENPITTELGEGLCKDLAIKGPLNFTYIKTVFGEAFKNNKGSFWIEDFDTTEVTALHGSVFYRSNLRGGYKFPTTLQLLDSYCFPWFLFCIEPLLNVFLSNK